MTDWQYFAIDINPEPWAIGPLSVIRQGGKMVPIVGRNTQLWHFKQAVKEAMGTQEMIEGPIDLKFWFWRRRDAYKTPQARTHRKHEADVTNLQKATEDALQGVLYKNDKDVKHIESIMVEQGEDVEPMIGIGIKPYSQRLPWIPDTLQEMIDDLEAERGNELSDNSWG
jgi:Holliday junction resolvase RusA-like endonuclease